MTETRNKIITILEQNQASLIPETPEQIADQIMELFEFKAPTKEECQKYILEKELMEDKTVDQIGEAIDLFRNYYISVGWVVGKNKKLMKSWKKALNNWCKRDWSKPSGAKSKIQESIKAYMILQNQKQ
jgi:hypothetical protein